MWPLFGMAEASWMESPTTWMSFAAVDSKSSQFTAHQRPFELASPVCIAMAPARIGGSTFSTSARTSSCSSIFTLRVRASTATALCCGRYSTMPAYCSAHTFLKSAGFDCTSGFASTP